MGIRIYQKSTFGRAIRFLSDRNIAVKDFVSHFSAMKTSRAMNVQMIKTGA